MSSKGTVNLKVWMGLQGKLEKSMETLKYITNHRETVSFLACFGGRHQVRAGIILRNCPGFTLLKHVLMSSDRKSTKVYGTLKQDNFYFWSACCCDLACSLFPGICLSGSLSSAMTKEFPVCWPTNNSTRTLGGSCSWHQAPVLRPSWAGLYPGWAHQGYNPWVCCLFRNHILQSLNINWGLQGHYSVKAAIGTSGFLTSLRRWPVGTAFDSKPVLAVLFPKFPNVSGTTQ